MRRHPVWVSRFALKVLLWISTGIAALLGAILGMTYAGVDFSYHIGKYL